jgi:hypothetical protein
MQLDDENNIWEKGKTTGKPGIKREYITDTLYEINGLQTHWEKIVWIL